MDFIYEIELQLCLMNGYGRSVHSENHIFSLKTDKDLATSISHEMATADVI